jgi:ribose transport system ATP-binding protein
VSNQNTVDGARHERADARSRLRVRGLSKTFPGTRALRAVDLEILPGEIHALVGGNGSGKSTLIKVITGVYHGDPGGTIEIDGVATPAESMTASAAHRSGVRVVHQDLGVFPAMTVAENLALGDTFATGPGGWISGRETRRRTQTLIDRFEIPATPDTPLVAMSRAGQTLVAMARALQDQDGDHGGLLILDEPTASLPTHEAEMLMDSLRRYAGLGQSILYVSHRLDEILALSDRVSVLRDGVSAGTKDASTLDENQLVQMIVGRRIERMFPARRPPRDRQRLLDVERLAVGPVRGASFHVDQGEIVGLAGVLGSGRTEILRAIFGDLPIGAGEIRFEGKPTKFKHPAQAIAAGVAMVPEDRASQAAFLDLPLTTNLSILQLGSYFRARVLREDAMRRDASELMSDFSVKAASEASLLETLSGGNQQKVIMARWLRNKPRLLLLDEPTQGVDVGARTEIYTFVREAVDNGAGALVVASDLEELTRVSDRVIVLRDGAVVAEAVSEQIDVEQITELAHGMEGVTTNGI